MAAGILEIAAYGSQDMYLTGVPEITFFQLIYRRHTKFSIDSLPVPFNNSVGFGLESTAIIPKIGDLIHKTYLEVTLPEINLVKKEVNVDVISALESAEENYQKVTNFMSLNRLAFIEAEKIFLASNTTIDLMKSKITQVYNQQSAIIDDFSNLPDKLFTFQEVSLVEISDNYIGEDKDELFHQLKIALDKSIKLQNQFYQNIVTQQKILSDQSNKNIKFAWIEKIGHFIIDKIEVLINGKVIDEQYGDYLEVNYQLSNNKDLDHQYNKLIGNVSELTTFDRSVKPRYKLQIPLNFWFTKHNGIALPMVALEHSQVSIRVKFKNLEDLSYLENNTGIFFNNEELLLSEISDQANLNISANLLIDTIFLDSMERKRFARVSHEYLIPQIQRLELLDITIPQQSIQLKSFSGLMKKLIWTGQQNKYIENISGYNKNQWDNYSKTDQGIENLVDFSSIQLGDFTRVPRLPSSYYNYVTPLESHYSTPSDGINLLSFAINPELIQPSGHLNISNIPRSILNIELGQIITQDNPATIRIYVESVNILRIVSGTAGLSFS